MPVNYLHNIDDLHNKEFTVVGYIAESKEYFTKKGIPYGKVTIEDFSGSYTFTFFSKQWSQWKKDLAESYSIAIKAKVEIPSWKKDNPEYQLNVKKVDILYNIKDKVFKSLEISIPIENIKSQLIDEIYSIIQISNKGTSKLKFILIDKNDKLDVELISKSIKIDITDEIVNKLSRSNLYKVKIN